MQILLSSLSLNNFLLFSYTPSAPIVHRHTSRRIKISPITPSSHRTISKIIIFCLQSISCCRTCFAYHTHLTKIITFFWRVRTIIASFYYTFCTTLPDWVPLFSNFYYEHHYIPFMIFSETTIYLIRFLHHIQTSCVCTRHTDFSQKKTAICSNEFTRCFISPPHIHFLHISVITMWNFALLQYAFHFSSHILLIVSPSFYLAVIILHALSQICTQMYISLWY